MKLKLLDISFWSLIFVIACGFIREFCPFYEIFWTPSFSEFLNSIQTNIWDWTPTRTSNSDAWIAGGIISWLLRMFAMGVIFFSVCTLIDKYKDLKEHLKKNDIKDFKFDTKMFWLLYIGALIGGVWFLFGFEWVSTLINADYSTCRQSFYNGWKAGGPPENSGFYILGLMSKVVLGFLAVVGFIMAPIFYFTK